MADDGKAYVDFLLAQKGVTAGKVGAVGYCFTGQMAVRIGRRRAGQGRGRGVFPWRLPGHRQARQPAQDSWRRSRRGFISVMRSKIPAATPEQVETLEAALRDWHGAFQSEFYEGARHGWTVPGRDVYNECRPSGVRKL